MASYTSLEFSARLWVRSTLPVKSTFRPQVVHVGTPAKAYVHIAEV